MQDELQYREIVQSDDVVVMIDPGTRPKKKNRKRHIKDGAPKSMRGVSHERRTEWQNSNPETESE